MKAMYRRGIHGGNLENHIKVIAKIVAHPL